MGKPILIRPSNDLWRWLREQAKAENRKPGPMVLILLERARHTALKLECMLKERELYPDPCDKPKEAQQ